jgi:hypothetical protein
MRETIGEWSLHAFAFLLPFAWIALGIGVLVLLPMALAIKTREAAGTGLVLASYLFGITTWLLGAGITFSTFGWFGLIVGLLLFGLGVVPLAIFATLFKLHLPAMALALFVMSVVVVGARIGGTLLTANAEQRKARLPP